MTGPRHASLTQKPLIFIEDHLFHIHELLLLLTRGDLPFLDQLTVVCLDNPGYDTDRTVLGWLEQYPGLQVVWRTESSDRNGLKPFLDRILLLEAEVFTDVHLFCKTMASLIRPGGLWLQDIQLGTLRFIAEDRWWETIFLANSVRGRFPENPPSCWFVSNKSGFDITFGKELMEAGFDPREVIDKARMARFLPDALDNYFCEWFPFILQKTGGVREDREEWLREDDADRARVASELDLVFWIEDGVVRSLGGAALADPKRHVDLKRGSHECRTWLDLAQNLFDHGHGVPVVDIGRRLAPSGALKAEMTNQAARHLHALRGRLRIGDAVITENHAYHLSRRLHIGRVVRRSPRRS